MWTKIFSPINNAFPYNPIQRYAQLKNMRKRGEVIENHLKLSEIEVLALRYVEIEPRAGK